MKANRFRIHHKTNTFLQSIPHFCAPPHKCIKICPNTSYYSKQT